MKSAIHLRILSCHTLEDAPDEAFTSPDCSVIYLLPVEKTGVPDGSNCCSADVLKAIDYYVSPAIFNCLPVSHKDE